MRRSTAAVVGTLTGTALLLGVRLSVGPIGGFSLESLTTSAPPGDGTGTDVRAQGAQPDPSTSGDAGATRNGGGAQNGSGTRSGGDGLRNGTFRGAASTYDYGTIQVTVTVSGGRLTDLRATYPTESRSAQINGRAIPALREQALAAQSAEIDTVSGATLTSASFRASLESALDVAAG